MQVESRIIPVLGHRRIDELTPEVLDAFYRRLTLEGGRNKQGLSRRSVRLVHTILRKAFADGVKRGTLATNPAARATPPKQTRQEFRTWSAAELRRFLDVARGHQLHAALFVAATTGMRRSEILGLRWSDVDLDAGRASIQQRVVLVDSKPTVLYGTKRESSRRLISLDPSTVEALAGWRIRQIEERLAAGERWQETGLVFTSPIGGPVSPELLSRTFGRLAEAAGLPRIRFHDIRHTYATLALQAGVPVKVVSERLGHKTTAITENLYLHVTPQMAEEAALRVATLILGNAGSTRSVNNP
jgi:integrase